MFKHILVPLDGSRLAETSLPAAVFLSLALAAEVTLIHIIEFNAPQEIHGDRHLSREKEALEYLNQISAQRFPPSVKVNIHVHAAEERNVARSIADHAGEMEPDLIILCAHGASGMRDMVVGSIAQQVIGRGKTPVLLLQPGDPNLPNPVRLESLLIALDGDSDHEQALQVAGELALHLNSSLNLLTVIPTMGTLSGEHAAAGRLLPGTASAMLDMTEECSIDYLEEAAQTWRDKGLKVFTGIRRGDPVHQIMAASKNMDLIVLGTHGKSGINAFWAGSVAPKVVPLAKVPLLLVPAEKSKQNH